MQLSSSEYKQLTDKVNDEMLQTELEQASSNYHIKGAWVAIIFDPIFAVTDYFNIPDSWFHLFIIRLSVSVVTFAVLSAWQKHKFPSYWVVMVPFLLISLQNAYTYNFVDNELILGHNLNYMALLIGGALFILWRIYYSITVVLLSILATYFFITHNSAISPAYFFVNGGLLLVMMSGFLILLIQIRYSLTLKEIRARKALEISNEEVRAQAEEIKGINENLDMIVKKRVEELRKANEVLEEYAFVNAHKLRAPVASVLGLINLLKKADVGEREKTVLEHLDVSAAKLDEIVRSITNTLDSGRSGKQD